MGKARSAFFAFNRGIVSRLGAARADIKRLALGAKLMTNWVCRTLGSMNIRPGMGYLGGIYNDAQAIGIPFIFSQADKAVLELTDSLMRVWINDVLVTRNSVSTAITNGTFNADITGWTDNDEAGAVSQWVAPGYMELVGTALLAAIRTQLVSVAVADRNVEHGLRIVIVRGPVTLRVGSSVGGDELISETALDEGTHSLTFTPAGDFYIRVQSRLARKVWIDSIAIEAAGTMTLPTPWPLASLSLIRHDQSGDIIFCACTGYQQRKIERRATRAWSVVKYLTEDGPFRIENTGPIHMTPSVYSGNGTMTASAAYFTSTMVGALMQHKSAGQIRTASATAENTFTEAIKITGVGNARDVNIVVSNTFVATAILQRSFEGQDGPWTDVGSGYTVPTTVTYTDPYDNSDAWFRLGVKTGAFTSGQVDLNLSSPVGSIKGIGRITAFTSSTVVDIEVLSTFGNTVASANWSEGQWSDRRGWPSATAFHEGRLWWGGKDKINGSVSDAFYSHNDDTVGDSGPISRSIGSGPVDTINYLIPLQRLVLGGQGAEFSCRSTSLDEPLTPTNFNLKPSSSQGSAAVAAVKVDSAGIMVQRGGTRVYELAIDPQTYDYSTTHLSAVIPEIGRAGIQRIAVQRQPETRVHFVLGDGTAAMLTFDKSEQLICWSTIETDGLIEDVTVLPCDTGEEEDHIYYFVKRTISSVTKRYLERWAKELDCRPNGAGVLTSSHLADSFIHYQGVATTVITGLGTLEGKAVTVWADGADVGYDDTDTLIYTVSGGQITLAVAASDVLVGLPYFADWESSKLLQIPMQMGTPIGAYKSIKGLALILADTHARGLKFGRTFAAADLDDMPSMEGAMAVDGDSIHVDYEHETMIFPGDYGTDERLCLRAMAPRPCTVVAAVIDVEAHE